MADTAVSITAGSGVNIDTRTESTNNNHRQVIVIGDPSTNAGVAPVDATNGLSVDVKALTGTLTGITNSINVYLGGTAGTIGARVGQIDGTVAVYFSPANPSVFVSNSPTITGITNSINVHLLSTGGTLGVRVGQVDGTVAVQFSQSNPAVNAQFGNIGHTASIFTVSGSTSTAGNNTVVSPSASYNFKVFAYSIQTTGLVSIAPRFTTGASAGATELWRPLITAASTTSSPVGANLAVTPPGFIFATGSNTTLSLYLDAATLVHYSVSYIKESA